MSDGFWYTRANGEREWRGRPRCECGGFAKTEQLKPMDEATEGEHIAQIVCQSCGKVQLIFVKPSEADLQRGRDLAERYGW